jgi:hypothetical protein
MFATIGRALAYGCIAWACAAVVAFLLSFAVSLEDLRVLLRRALRISAPAMCFAPAALFLAAWSPLRAIVGLLLVANTVRLLVSRMERPAPRQQKRPRNTRIFRYSNVRTGVFSTDSMLAILGAFALQGGVVAMLEHRTFIAAILVGTCAAAWTVSSINRHAYEPSTEPGTRHTLASILLILLLSTGISVSLPRMNPNAATLRAIPAGADRVSMLDAGAIAKRPAIPKVLLSGKELVPGVILIPPAKGSPQPGLRLFSAHLGIYGSRSLTFPFTGEYHLFPTSSGRLEPGSAVFAGTPLDAVYATLGGGPLETHGYQKLNPPIDFSNCARIQVIIINGERSPGSGVAQLIHASGPLNLGSDAFGLEPGPEESLSFEVPQTGARLLVNAIRVAFYRDPTHRDESTRVAIKSFTLVPRGL